MPTPPSRRRPVTPPTTPARRPRVAGLHRPSATEPVESPEPVEPVSVEDGVLESDEVREDVHQAEESVVVSEPVLGVEEEPAVEAVAEDDEPVPAPRPAGKRRAAGSSVPVDLTTAEQRSGVRVLPRDERSIEELAAAARNRSINLAIALGVVALILAGLAIWFRGQADSLTGGADGNNRALTDSALTSEVKGKLTVAIEKTLSYNFTDLDATAKAVKEHLAGTAVCEYDKLFGVLKEQAPAQKLILTTKVRDLGVTRLEGDKADLLVFVDQSTTRTEQNQTTASGAQFGIRAEKIDGAWKITDFDMLDQPLPDGKAAPTC
ncbi:putative integral membrane protein [Alloactinosynnema sp. L-07]|uniref:hypothetical protein n=1 Tax=Alloactinosynnema sp. L-07 TaxID=1653480 RepID=UPI00065EF49B|nr:hypothetical protein [Alloactinosynnema sp. L-07]CRK60067.1 putative integral membrane protein [Alloactinosynnema sp. L-07]